MKAQGYFYFLLFPDLELISSRKKGKTPYDTTDFQVAFTPCLLNLSHIIDLETEISLMIVLILRLLYALLVMLREYCFS